MSQFGSTSLGVRDEALLKAIHVHGVPVRTLARAMGVSRQTIYRRAQRARIRLRRVMQTADVAAPELPDDEE